MIKMRKGLDLEGYGAFSKMFYIVVEKSMSLYSVMYDLYFAVTSLIDLFRSDIRIKVFTKKLNQISLVN